MCQVIHSNGIACVPMLDEGPFQELCFRMKETLKQNGMEGVVLTGDEGSLFKWKTSAEDESSTHKVLSSLMLQHPPTLLEAAGISIDLLQCLIDVATKPPTLTAKKGRSEKSKQRMSKNDKKAAYEVSVLETALVSAMSKYDSLEAYFERGLRSEIIALLNKELVEDLGASTSEETRCVKSAVGKKVGRAFASWKMTQ